MRAEALGLRWGRGNIEDIPKQEILEVSFCSYTSARLTFLWRGVLSVTVRKTTCAYFPQLPQTEVNSKKGRAKIWCLLVTDWNAWPLINHWSSKEFVVYKINQALPAVISFGLIHTHTHRDRQTDTHTHCTTTPLLIWLLFCLETTLFNGTSAMVEMPYVCAVHWGNHQPSIAVEHLKCATRN